VAAAPAASAGAIVEVKVPDIGDFADVPVIELFVKVGDSIKAEDAIATLESDKATMDVPSSATGVVKEVLVQLGSRVSEGAVLIKVETGAGAAAPAAAPQGRSARRRPHRVAGRRRPAPTPPVNVVPIPAGHHHPRAHQARRPGARQPSVRAFARELGVDLAQVKASGPKNRITKADVTAFIKGAMSTGVVPGKAVAAAPSAAWAAGSTCCRGRRWISPSSARSTSSRCRASRRSPARTSPATGR
jgi:pyruvate dehydrogenase E2 component (dihydrolipoamide acetyltransferase)